MICAHVWNKIYTSYLEKEKSEDPTRTERIEGKRARNRQRLTFLGLLQRSTCVKTIQLYRHVEVKKGR